MLMGGATLLATKRQQRAPLFWSLLLVNGHSRLALAAWRPPSPERAGLPELHELAVVKRLVLSTEAPFRPMCPWWGVGWRHGTPRMRRFGCVLLMLFWGDIPLHCCRGNGGQPREEEGDLRVTAVPDGVRRGWLDLGVGLSAGGKGKCLILIDCLDAKPAGGSCGFLRACHVWGRRRVKARRLE